MYRKIGILAGVLVFGISPGIVRAQMAHEMHGSMEMHEGVMEETGTAQETKSVSVKSETETKKPTEVGNEYCPVMGEKIAKGKEVKYAYKGKIYNFCCPDCIKQFKKAPEKYIKKISEGIPLGEESKKK